MAAQTSDLDGALHAGRTVWALDAPPPTPTRPPPARLNVDIAIVGAGVTGAFLADRLARGGRTIAVFDRHAPQRASTAASTALLLWELDAPMLALEDRLGFEVAAAIYQRSAAALTRIAARVAALDNPCAFATRPSLYLAGDTLDPADLREEQHLRAMAGLPTRSLDEGALQRDHAIEAPWALLSSGSAEADPVRLARALMDSAMARGAQVFSPATVTEFICEPTGVTLRLEDGAVCTAQALVLANGYEMPDFVPAHRHAIVSTWALATAPQRPAALWSERALIWEASDPYFYARTTHDNRLVIGGCDEPIHDAEARDALTPAKTALLKRRLSDFAPGANLALDAVWTGFFGQTDDSLPLIGPVPGRPHCYAAFGYGGNGITFSAMAADLIATHLGGARDPAFEWFAVDR